MFALQHVVEQRLQRRTNPEALTEFRALLVLVALQLAIVVAVDARGNFPVNDDWVYAHSVRWLLDEHRLRLSDWTTSNLLPQTLAAGAVSAVFGYSLEVLRHLTQVVALFASAAVFFWFRAVRLSPSQALTASLATIAMPFWPVLANSYMSDLYGLLFAIPSATLFLHALSKPSRGTLLAATTLAAVGTLERQVVITVAFAFMVAWLTTRRQDSWRTLAQGCAPFALALAAAGAYHAYLAYGPGVPAAQQAVESRVLPMLAKAITGVEPYREIVAANLLSMTGYLGLLFAGWAAWWGMRGATRRMRATVVGGGFVLAAAALAFTWLPPYREYFVMDAAGIGPFTLYDGVPRGIADFDRSPGVLWRVAGVGAAFGAAAWIALLLVNLLHVIRERRRASPQRVFMLTVIVAYLGPFVVSDYFDRYLLFVMPFAFALWAITWPRGEAGLAHLRRGFAIAWTVAMLAISSAATHDYFAWNRVRWQAIALAESLGATPSTLDGGYEYNGYESDEQRKRTAGKSWWWVEDDRYIVAFSLLPGYHVLRTFAVPHWLPRSPAEIRLLLRND